MAERPERPGFLLVASPELQDPNFARTVVLTIAHDDEGTYGLVLNRPLERRLADLIPDVAEPARDVPLFRGGPVQTDVLQLLCGGGGRAILEGVSVGEDLDSVVGAAADGHDVRGYVGYAGWGALQLEQETSEGAWIVAPARREHVFAIPSAALWSRVLSELGGQYRWMSLEGGDPDIN